MEQDVCRAALFPEWKSDMYCGGEQQEELHVSKTRVICFTSRSECKHNSGQVVLSHAI